MRGILGHGAYLPHRRLDRTTIAAVAGGGGGKGTRTVASFDEDTTTLGVEAGRLALRSVPAVDVRTLLFSTVEPAYLDKTNATAIHAALRLPDDVPALDLGGAVRSAAGALRLALGGGEPALVIGSGIRTGLPGSADEAAGGDAAAGLVVGSDADGPLLAELLGTGSATEEFVDRWRTPGDSRSKLWEERFGEIHYVALGKAAWADALKASGVDAADVGAVAVAATHARAVRGLTKGLGVEPAAVADDLTGTVGMTGAAHPGLLLSSLLEAASPGQVLALVVLADGADVFLFRATDAVATQPPVRPIADQVDGGAPIPYGTFLRWRGVLAVEPPRRPEPARVSASAAARSSDWKFGFVATRSDGGEVQLPPKPGPGAEPLPMADATGTVATFTVDRLAWSPSPPIVFAVVDFDGGGRLPVELTDVEAEDVAIGDRVELTFRRLSTADGIHNYFWKARPLRSGSSAES
jgi:3-hydroxy-3-methylglutaryl CoA synthase